MTRPEWMWSGPPLSACDRELGDAKHRQTIRKMWDLFKGYARDTDDRLNAKTCGRHACPRFACAPKPLENGRLHKVRRRFWRKAGFLGGPERHPPPVSPLAVDLGAVMDLRQYRSRLGVDNTPSGRAYYPFSRVCGRLVRRTLAHAAFLK